MRDNGRCVMLVTLCLLAIGKFFHLDFNIDSLAVKYLNMMNLCHSICSNICIKRIISVQLHLTLGHTNTKRVNDVSLTNR